eukprot:CAMPEP_0183599732 /NCGR_PEP_ID=MMETSP0371-20130417/179583_1 /TAXON_ID=268820 /ORGANISM="Peridinium aciculiferum, Strain PAER-2" /LENGTH=78 /DNA_ID=CAMNT_0025811803 /DNA_START=168 /DNA_END=404 /DNA_ORIENTATION=-
MSSWNSPRDQCRGSRGLPSPSAWRASGVYWCLARLVGEVATEHNHGVDHSGEVATKCEHEADAELAAATGAANFVSPM